MNKSLRCAGFLQQPSNQLQPRYSALNEVYCTSDSPTDLLPKHAHPSYLPSSLVKACLFLLCFSFTTCLLSVHVREVIFYREEPQVEAAAFLIRSLLKS